MCKGHVLYGLYCDKNDCHTLSPLSNTNPKFIIEMFSESDNSNSYQNSNQNEDTYKIIKNTFDCNLPYNQTICTFCYQALCNNLLIFLECKHVFHVNCFINYMKVKYIDKTTKDTDKNRLLNASLNCPICRASIPNFLSIFEKYKELLVFIEQHFVKNE
jgi:hypothetical protein